MKMFRKQTARAPLTTVLLVLLLALSIAASSIGFAAWTGANKQFEEIDSQYTTIAILSGKNYEKIIYQTAYFTGLDSFKFPDGTKYIGPQSAKVAAQESEYFISADSNVMLSAHVDGTTAITSGTTEVLNYNSALDDFGYSLSVFAVRCKEIDEWEHIEGINWTNYNVTFEILDNICVMDVYDLPPYNDNLSLTSSLYTRDGEMPFEVGKTYLVRGRYGDYPIGFGGKEIVRDENGKTQANILKKRMIGVSVFGRSLLMEGDGDMITSSVSNLGVASGVQNFTKEKIAYTDRDWCYWTTPENCWPYYAEYEGSWQDFLETEDGRVWKEEIIPNFQINHESAAVILTDNLGTLYSFNSGDATILEGRSIEKEEFSRGDAVCLVSASYAQLNNLAVGDSIKLEYYDTGITHTIYQVDVGGRQGFTVSRFPLTENSRMDIQKEYTIVGIYTAPEWSAGQHSFHADTIFVPKTSVPGMDTYVGKSLPMLNSIVIENGSIDAFEAHMAENGMAGVYLYFDQGYTEAAATVQTLIDNAMRLMLVGVAMFMLASMLFLLLFARRVSAVMRSMRLLGVPKRKTWLESLGMLAMQEVIAVLLGNGLAVILYDRITAQLLSGTPALDITSIALCAGVQLALLIAAGGVWMHRIAGSNLMQKSEGGKLLWNKNRAASCGA